TEPDCRNIPVLRERVGVGTRDAEVFPSGLDTDGRRSVAQVGQGAGGRLGCSGHVYSVFDLSIVIKAICYRFGMALDSEPEPIKGDVIPGSTRRLDDGLVEVRLIGHDHRYVVGVDISGPAPRLTELRIVADSPEAEIDPATIRQVPVRRLAAAAARFVAHADGA